MGILHPDERAMHGDGAVKLRADRLVKRGTVFSQSRSDRMPTMPSACRAHPGAQVGDFRQEGRRSVTSTHADHQAHPGSSGPALTAQADNAMTTETPWRSGATATEKTSWGRLKILFK